MLLSDHTSSGLPAGAVPGSAELVPEPADRSDLAALPDRRRQPQLLRRAHDLLSRLLRQSRSKVPVIHPVIDYANVYQPPDPRRRIQLQDQLHQPEPRPRRFDPITTLANTNGLCLTDIRRSAGADARATACCAACPAPTRASRPKRNGGVVHRPDRPDLDAVCDRCAPTPSTPRSRTSRAFRTSCPSATPTRCA